jgi:hypothetical protein
MKWTIFFMDRIAFSKNALVSIRLLEPSLILLLLKLRRGGDTVIVRLLQEYLFLGNLWIVYLFG